MSRGVDLRMGAPVDMLLLANYFQKVDIGPEF